MSSLTRCNYCDLRSIRKDASRKKQEVTVRESTSDLGGIDVFVHPPNEAIDEEKHFAAWFGALTDYCCC